MKHNPWLDEIKNRVSPPIRDAIKGGAGSGDVEGHEFRGNQYTNEMSPALESKLVHLSGILRDKLKEKSIERGYVLDYNTADIVATAIGGKHGISSSAREGQVFLHSHPGADNVAGITTKDVLQAKVEGIAVVAVVHGNVLYILERGQNGWGDLTDVSQYDPHSISKESAARHGWNLKVINI